MRRSIFMLGLAVVSIRASAQAPSAQGFVAPHEATQFDFLVGQWELTVKPAVSPLVAKIHGIPSLTGTWKGWRAMDGWGIEDEMRIADHAGNPMALVHSLRAFDPAGHMWKQTGVDPFHSMVSSSMAEWKDVDHRMISNGSGADASGKPYLVRSTFSAITATSFHYEQVRSFDGGKSWDDPNVVIDAKKVAAAATR